MVAEDSRPVAVTLAGPTASGKTDIAIQLAEQLPVSIVSVDSAMVYRGMDIGTAKPDSATLTRAPHSLIDIRDPENSYSAGDFRRDALAEMHAIWDAGRLPLLVGGTMLYFRALAEGIADLPAANAQLRAEIDAEAAKLGWPALHRRLADLDPATARRIQPRDSQRIQRALEVCISSGRPMSEILHEGRTQSVEHPFRFKKLALVPGDRQEIYRRVELRFRAMLETGLLAEVEELYTRPSLTAAASSMRAVGYRQLWQYLDDELSFEQACQNAIVATRRLAKRQLTWLRSETGLRVFDPLVDGEVNKISAEVATLIR